jgi:hypothetical protein
VILGFKSGMSKSQAREKLEGEIAIFAAPHIIFTTLV